MDRLLFIEGQAPDVEGVLAKANSFLEKSESFVLGVLAFRSKERVDSRAETLKLFLSLGSSLALLTLTMSFIIVMLFRQAKISRDSYKKAKRLTIELKAAVKTAQQASTVKSNFLATMSHEIRTPMNAIIGLTHLVIDSGIDDKQKIQLEKIQKSTESLLFIINDILDFTKIESGKMSLEKAPYCLDDVLDYIYYLNKDVASSKGLRFTVSRDFSIAGFLIGDKIRLQQILINLISNAIKFTSSGFISVNVYKGGENSLIFEVKDSGIGISKGANIFDAFTQADTSTTRLYGGTGLGLSISKKLVELLGGKVSYDTEIGKGTCFSISLPYQPESASTDLSGSDFFVVENDTLIRSILSSLHIEPIKTITLDDVGDVQKTPVIVSDEWLDTSEKYASKGLPPLFYTKVLVIGMDVAVSRKCLVTSLITPKQISEKFLQINVDGEKVEKKSTLSRLSESQSMVGKKVLLAEDNKINADIAKALLEKMSLSVDWVENGQHAFEHATNNHYDLILMDIRMPIMDGYEASDKIQKALQDKKPPIIALTADSFTMTNKSISKQGIDDVLSKPIDPALMLAKLESWMPEK
ncbi:ATP-binding protein [Marinomonas transparens]|uniref:Sensory/regulatory protein RpfC n=1 Tax=Marinomonas transparens TaxID=2795388 RepID=A0A934JVE7_9GAMM|nr:ATP-binding protein [Marinomonas transparens]MBJ7537747.1 response regulator [Marinomonas transparens]